jgi:hypothetical protein
MLHEVGESMVDHCPGDGRNRNTTNEDDLHLEIVFYGLFDKISVLLVSLEATS